MRNIISMSKSRAGVALLMLLVAGVTFALQSYNVGFWGWRHGWTSSHSLSIIRRAVPENRFVGYALAFRDENGDPTYEYFDRYPVFFSAGMNALLAPIDDLPTQIYASRQVMNALLLLTMFVGYRLVRLYVPNRYLALAISVLAFSSYYYLYYKDMPDFHPPVVLSFLALAYSIARYRLHGERVQVYVVALAAVMLAFGYTILFALAVWLALEIVRVFLAPTPEPDGTVEGRLNATLHNIRRLDALWIFILGVLLSAGAIAYNVSAEAAIRGVPLAETSVVDSILRRIPFLETAVDANAREQVATTGITGWAQFFVVEFERVVKWSLPLKAGGDTGVRFVPGETSLDVVNLWLVALGVPLALITARFIARQRGALRDVAIITAVSPLVFLFSMINLTSVHDFVTMFAAPTALIMWTALLGWAGRSRVLVGVLVVASIGLYSASNYWVRAVQQSELPDGAPFTYDFDRILTALAADGDEWDTIYLDYRRHNAECIIRNWQCYALGYYLGDNFLTHYPQHANFVLSPRPYYATDTFITPGDSTQLAAFPANPENEVVYLMDMAAAQPRTTPTLDEPPIASFNGALTMQSWSLHGDVRVPRCGRVFVESWWIANAQQSEALNMQVVMVDAANERVTDFNAPLGAVATSLWEVGKFTADVRPITVPCDTPPGEYPLVLGVYNPADLAPVPTVDENGDPTANQLYLTTLFVE